MSKEIVPMERIQQAIFLIRGKKVMLDRDLAALYGVTTKALKQAVRRHADRFPEDFMFVLNTWEFKNWRSHFVTSKADRKGLRYAPMAFYRTGYCHALQCIEQRACYKSQYHDNAYFRTIKTDYDNAH